MTIRRPWWLDAALIIRTAPFLVLILLAAAISYRYHALLRDQRARVEHTYQVIEQLQTALVGMIDAETGQRGYVLTGDERYLVPYRKALVGIPASLDVLRRRVGDSATEVGRVDTLRRLVEDKFDELQSTVTARQTSGFEAARMIVLADHGRETMDALRDVIDAMQHTELTLLQERGAAARRTERHLLITTLICAGLSLIARIGLALTMHRPKE